MSLLDSLTKKSRLNSYIKQTAQARKSEGAKADHLFKTVYQGYAEIVGGDPLRAEALYFWGHALLHQAKTKAGEEAARLYRDAIAKFSFCMTIEPNYLAAAIDGGVAYMDLARLQGVAFDDELYSLARKEFEKANAIQAGAASYNLACIAALQGDSEACLKALDNAKNKGSLPDAADILNDPDLASVKNQDWFLQFMETLNEPKQANTPLPENPPAEETKSEVEAEDKTTTSEASE
jgi:tetratricopeptide (TPR) repeat protein